VSLRTKPIAPALRACSANSWLCSIVITTICMDLPGFDGE